MAIFDLLESKPSFLQEFWQIPPYPGEPDLFDHRVSYLVPQGNKKAEKLHFAYGSGLSEEEAVGACLGEAVERYSAWRPDLRKIRIATWKELGRGALHPGDLAGYSRSQYRRSGFPYSPFTEETSVGWIQGSSLVHGDSVWVPAQMVFLSPWLKKETPVFSKASTGLACGSSREQAVLSGLCEVVERDAFAIMWLNKLSMPLVAFEGKGSASHPLKRILEEKFLQDHLRYAVIQMTTDLGIPAYCVMVKQTPAGWPNAVVGSGCRLNAIEAIKSGLVEASSLRASMLYRRRRFEKFTRGQSLRRVFQRIVRATDRGRVYADSRFFRYERFLEASLARIPLNRLPNFSKGNLKKDLETCLAILKKKGYNVIVADITPREVAAYDLTVVKVIIPGLQPLHLGQNFEYLRSRRLYEAPMLMGYRDRPTTEKEIYRIPHPFM